MTTQSQKAKKRKNPLEGEIFGFNAEAFGVFNLAMNATTTEMQFANIFDPQLKKDVSNFLRGIVGRIVSAFRKNFDFDRLVNVFDHYLVRAFSKGGLMAVLGEGKVQFNEEDFAFIQFLKSNSRSLFNKLFMDVVIKIEDLILSALEEDNSWYSTHKALDEALKFAKYRVNLISTTELQRSMVQGFIGVCVKDGARQLRYRAEPGECHMVPTCQSLNGFLFDINQAIGLIPRHTNCQCYWERIK